MSQATKHLHLAFHEIKEHVDAGHIKLIHVAGTDNPADILTKYVERPLIDKMLSKIGMTKLPTDGGWDSPQRAINAKLEKYSQYPEEVNAVRDQLKNKKTQVITFGTTAAFA